MIIITNGLESIDPRVAQVLVNCKNEFNGEVEYILMLLASNTDDFKQMMLTARRLDGQDADQVLVNYTNNESEHLWHNRFMFTNLIIQHINNGADIEQCKHLIKNEIRARLSLPDLI